MIIRSLAFAGLGYLVAGAAWSSVVSLQRGLGGLDPVNGAFAMRGLLRALTWPFDVARTFGLPWSEGAVGLVLLVCLLAVLAARFSVGRRTRVLARAGIQRD